MLSSSNSQSAEHQKEETAIVDLKRYASTDSQEADLASHNFPHSLSKSQLEKQKEHQLKEMVFSGV
jgi:hypothetical protein